MIQPQELRIGNYYQGASRGNIKTVTWQTLRDLSEGKLNLLPMPLTEEILLKFGFEKKQIRDELKNKLGDYAFSLNNIPFFTLIEDNDGFMLSKFETYITTVVYIHQLQNLYFDLTGEEITFKKYPMTTLQALKLLKTEFKALNAPQKDGSLKSLMQLEDVLIQIVKELKPEVRRFVDAQKRKDTRTVEQMYIEQLRKEKRKNKKPPNSWR